VAELAALGEHEARALVARVAAQRTVGSPGLLVLRGDRVGALGQVLERERAVLARLHPTLHAVRALLGFLASLLELHLRVLHRLALRTDDAARDPADRQ